MCALVIQYRNLEGIICNYRKIKVVYFTILKGEEMTKQKVDIVFEYLERLFPDPKCALNFSTPFETLVAVMLSAQTTDENVNKVTEKLFKVSNTPEQFAKIPQRELEKYIYSTGFYHTKSRNLIKMSKQLIENYNGEIPHDAREMENLAGVGRKTSNVVASILFDAKLLGVDTHVFRVLNRVGLVKANTPEKTELQFVEKYPQYVDHDVHYRLVLFGRQVCHARKPDCAKCELKDVCNYYNKIVKNKAKHISIEL